MRPKLLELRCNTCSHAWLVLRTKSRVDPAGLSVLRDRNQLFKSQYSQGLVENTYTLKVISPRGSTRTRVQTRCQWVTRFNLVRQTDGNRCSRRVLNLPIPV
ncbi:hypothetical protein OH492_01190 [Vibrio chagasii]|nr:hypothetical protein [Vibrio chagasii]